MVDEFVGTLRFVRYGIRALGLYREIGHFSPPTGITHPTSIVYDASYGPKPRNLVDVYTPCGEDASSVVLFVHGGKGCRVGGVQMCVSGVWCSGEKWQYAPIAKELSMQGVLTCVMSYTLFPHAMARDIAAEVNVALDWVMDNVAHPCSSVPSLLPRALTHADDVTGDGCRALCRRTQCHDGDARSHKDRQKVRTDTRGEAFGDRW